MTPAADDEDVGGAFALQCCYQGGDEDLVAAGVDLPILLYGSPDISGPECTFYRSPRFDSRHPYRAGEAAAQATAKSERTRLWLLANRVQAISQASMMSARLVKTELASQWLRK